MVYITHSGENVEKINNIIAVAQKRFGLYGLEKTTMKEIASDLGISKAALYYYFPDKESLFKGVIEAELDEFFDHVTKRLQELSNPEVMLKEFIRIRQEHFKDIMNMDIFRMADFHIIKPHIKDTFRHFRERETGIIESIIRKGKKSEVFVCQDPATTADLFIDILQGLRMVVMKHRDFRELGEEDYNLMEARHLEFIHLFIKALKNN